MSSTPLDLGRGVTLEFFCWKPDRAIQNPEWHAKYDDVPDIERMGALLEHPDPKSETGRCMGAINFDTPEVRRVLDDDRHRWQVESWEPLTISPSVLCRRCGHHGFIRGGKWVPA